MRAVWMVIAGLVAMSVCAASAQTAVPARPQFKWCHVQPPDYMYVCVYRSIDECRLDIPGMGGYCNLNPRYVEPPAKPTKRVKRKAVR